MEFGASANQQLSSDDVEASGKRAHRDSGAVCDDCRLDRSRKSRVARGDADRPQPQHPVDHHQHRVAQRLEEAGERLALFLGQPGQREGEDEGEDKGEGADTGKVARSTLWDGVEISIITKDSVDVDSIIYIDHDNSIYIYFSQQ